jgi:hypothetical protein
MGSFAIGIVPILHLSGTSIFSLSFTTQTQPTLCGFKGRVVHFIGKQFLEETLYLCSDLTHSLLSSQLEYSQFKEIFDRMEYYFLCLILFQIQIQLVVQNEVNLLWDPETLFFMLYELQHWQLNTLLSQPIPENRITKPQAHNTEQ